MPLERELKLKSPIDKTIFTDTRPTYFIENNLPHSVPTRHCTKAYEYANEKNFSPKSYTYLLYLFYTILFVFCDWLYSRVYQRPSYECNIIFACSRARKIFSRIRSPFFFFFAVFYIKKYCSKYRKNRARYNRKKGGTVFTEWKIAKNRARSSPRSSYRLREACAIGFLFFDQKKKKIKNKNSAH